MNNQAIGIFDSGIGGLTVATQIAKVLPNESLVYLGDTARVPYGTRGSSVIKQFSKELVTFLLSKKVKALVVACNTISAVALEDLFKNCPVPIIGVVKPTVAEVIKTSKSKRVGVIGTKATIASQIYKKEIYELDPLFQVYQVAAPMLVPLVEEGLQNHGATKLLLLEYLDPILDKIDTLVLGCTHYPLLTHTIKELINPKITIVESGLPTARALQELLQKKQLLAQKKSAQSKFYFTDLTEQTKKIAGQFFGGQKPQPIEKIKL
ncbi:glutamate racemase [Candidatus Beckwithbacteria bacterium]|nr:glutamate racemase [Candidatus Beckwithbacteria bacterium]